MMMMMMMTIIIIQSHTQRHTHRKSRLGEFVKKMGKQSKEWENINSWFKNKKKDRQCRNTSVYKKLKARLAFKFKF